MGRARRARKIAATAAYGGGGLAAASAALGAVGYAVIKGEALLARRIVGTPFDSSPDDDGTYGAGPGEPIEILVLGDSSAAGMGAHNPHETVGAIVASGVSALMGRRVHLTNCAVVGAESSDLERQLAEGLESITPDVVVVMVGANDVTHRVDRATAVRHLELTVRRIRALGAEVVVGTCPDLGTIEPLAQPLRLLARRWSRDLAAAQTIAVVEAGGRTVSLGDLLGHEFAASPKTMFSEDRFHPSPAGYARAAAALLPSVCAALGVWGHDTADRAPEARRGEGVGPVAVAAGQAVKDAGTEVSPTEVGGQARGPRGRWAVLLRRRHDAVPSARDPQPDASGAAEAATSGTSATPGTAAAASGATASGQAAAQVGQPLGELGDPR
ncbi:SGNH/GDSL hydrolase family protein [Knoellia locipacati]|uniref:Lipase n=1 Tax=Knoellia locipacati TaxID=882824 RepID=A0A512SX96_9MICO|nr:SGNH/GDSL hydrolase family protein [Knoellia locipacati]GEQ12544.1 lipase [Knoellia locipacati]